MNWDVYSHDPKEHVARMNIEGWKFQRIFKHIGQKCSKWTYRVLLSLRYWQVMFNKNPFLLLKWQRFARSFFFGSTIRSRSFCQKWIYNPIRSFHPPEKRIYDPILSDPFRSFPIRSLSCILKDTVPQILRFLKSHDSSNDCKIS